MQFFKSGWTAITCGVAVFVTVTPVFGNSTCETAEPIAISGSDSDDTSTGTNQGAPDCNGISQVTTGRWYLVTGDGTALTASVDLIGFWAPALTVYCPEGSCPCVEMLTCVDSSALVAGGGSFPVEVTWCSGAGQEYYILVHGEEDVSPNTGEYTLDVTSDFVMCGSPVSCPVPPDPCPPDVDDSGGVDVNDLLAALADACAGDLNDDGVVDDVDLAYIVENFGRGCPDVSMPGAVELFDDIAIVDATDRPALALGLLVTHVYATGSGVGPDDALLVANAADVDASGSTLFFQEPVVGGDVPPSSADIATEPAVAHDTFVTIRLLQDASLVTDNLTLTATTLDGDWWDNNPERQAVDISAATGQPGQFGVRIAQITMVRATGLLHEYAGTIDLYTSPFDGGSLQGAQAAVSFRRFLPDLNDDGTVDVSDLLLLLANWGTNGPGAGIEPPYDDANVADLLTILAFWGPAP